MVTEDFSFPMVTTNPITLFTLAPSLWPVSSDLVYSDCLDEDIGREERFSRKSFSCVESKVMREMDVTSKESEEKMDMLWEDFNEELQRVCLLNKKREVERSLSNVGLDSESEGETGDQMAELCCVQTLKMSKTRFGMVHPKRRSMVVVLKVLKKLFFLHNLARVKKIKS